jgi:hypothetical protein
MANIRPDLIVKGNVVMHDHSVADIPDITEYYERKYSKTYTVKADGTGDFVNVTAAIAGTTDRASDNRYLIEVYGTVVETACVNFPDYLDFVGYSSATIELRATGAINSSAFYTYASTDYPFYKDITLDWYSSVENPTGSYHYTLYVGYGGGLFVNCTFKRTYTGGRYKYTVSAISTSQYKTVFQNCNFKAADVGVSSLYYLGGTNTFFNNCFFEQVRAYSGIGTFNNCVFEGLPTVGGTALLTEGSSATFNGCKFYGNELSSSSYPLTSMYNSTDTFNNCVFIRAKDPFASVNYVGLVRINGKAIKQLFNSCIFANQEISQCTAVYVSHTQNTWRPSTSVASKKWQVVTLTPYIYKAEAGKTMSIGTTAGASNVGTVDMSTTGYKEVTKGVDFYKEVAAGGYWYFSFDGTPATNICIPYGTYVCTSGLTTIVHALANTSPESTFLNCKMISYSSNTVVDGDIDDLTFINSIIESFHGYGTSFNPNKASTVLNTYNCAYEGNLGANVVGTQGSLTELSTSENYWLLDEDDMASDSDTKPATQQSIKAYADTKVAKAGDTMTGLLTLSGAPTNDLHAATKKYVDDLTKRVEKLESIIKEL